MEIRIANQQVSVKQHGGYRRFVENCLRLRWESARPIVWGQPKGTVQAEVIRSNWVVRCPYCSSAMFAQPGEPFFCADCAMQGNDWLPMVVIWPVERKMIEQILVMRKNPNHRNWLGESLAELMAENVAHGEMRG